MSLINESGETLSNDLINEFYREIDEDGGIYVNGRQTIPKFSREKFNEIIKEINRMHNENIEQVQLVVDENKDGSKYIMPVRLRHALMERMKRSLLIYVYNRCRSLQRIRWIEGATILSRTTSEKLHMAESDWYRRYCRNLTRYLLALNEDEECGLDITLFSDNLPPPKSLYIQVKCLRDYGDLELSSGGHMKLRRDTQYYLPSVDCYHLIRQGILLHIRET
ncbi:hypothetical protein SNEBB_005502 [Seison nebaliae]|nr:hypothetical protein SNEBB_005502 [Seison nebaliae]